jgi:hypothetical protein
MIAAVSGRAGALAIALLAASAAGVAAPGAARAQYAIPWWTVDGGGGNSAGGTLGLSGTIGQPDAGLMSGGSLTLSGGFWAGGLLATAVDEQPAEEGPAVPGLPTVFSMHGAVPNPFNPSTRIAFDLPQARRVRLVAYDLSGRAVRTLLAEEKAAGRHAVDWDGRDDAGRTAASGIYFIRLVAGDFVASQKVVLTK